MCHSWLTSFTFLDFSHLKVPVFDVVYVRELHEVDSGNTKIMNFSYLLHVFIVHCAKSPSATRLLMQRIRVDDFQYILVGVLRRVHHAAACMQHGTTGLQVFSSRCCASVKC